MAAHRIEDPARTLKRRQRACFGMRTALLVALAASLTLAGLPGCLEDGLSLMTAKEAREKADGHAEEWADDAELVAAAGFEAGAEAREQMADAMLQGRQAGSPAGDMEEDDAERFAFGAVSGTPDDDIGDGRAPAWILSYSSEDKDERYQVIVTSDSVFAEEQAEEGFTPFGMGAPIEGWQLDSDAGADVAREDKYYANAVSDPGAMAITMLFQGTSGPVWLFGAGSEQDDGEAMVAVSAVDGEVIDTAEILGEVLGFVPREAGSDSGSIAGAVVSSFSSAFDVQIGGHGVLVVLVSVTPPPVVAMEVTVTDPAGTEYTATLDPAVGVDATAIVVVNAVPTGEYGVSVFGDVVVANDWEISWCTDGEAIVPIPSRACELVDSGLQRTAPAGPALWETLSPLGRSPWA